MFDLSHRDGHTGHQWRTSIVGDSWTKITSAKFGRSKKSRWLGGGVDWHGYRPAGHCASARSKGRYMHVASSFNGMLERKQFRPASRHIVVGPQSAIDKAVGS